MLGACLGRMAMRATAVSAALVCGLMVGSPTFGAARVKPVDPVGKAPVAAVRPVTEDYFGTKITDPYRYMEDLHNPEVTDWMKAQGAHTRGVLDSIKPRAGLLERVSQFGASFGIV